MVVHLEDEDSIDEITDSVKIQRDLRSINLEYSNQRSSGG